MRKVFKGTLEVDAEWLRWATPTIAEEVIYREIKRIIDPWYRKIDFEPATSVRFRQTDGLEK